MEVASEVKYHKNIFSLKRIGRFLKHLGTCHTKTEKSVKEKC
jgi:hypothetical protein